jgi:hypothetical protein
VAASVGLVVYFVGAVAAHLRGVRPVASLIALDQVSDNHGKQECDKAGDGGSSDDVA